MQCPRCAFEQADGGEECPRCGVIFAKLHPRGTARPGEPGGMPPSTEPLGQPSPSHGQASLSRDLPYRQPSSSHGQPYGQSALNHELPPPPYGQPSTSHGQPYGQTAPSHDLPTPPHDLAPLFIGQQTQHSSLLPPPYGPVQPPTSPTLSPREWLWALLFPPTDRNLVATGGRALVWLGLLVWGWKFLRHPVDQDVVGESFMHLINLPFHEAGHVFFMPLGRFMSILGGSLGQVLMPLICLATLLIKTRDAFGASVCLWWAGQSLMDLAPYIDDARALNLVLLGGFTGKESDSHDWNNILTDLGWLRYDHRIAGLAFDLGALWMVLAFVWGAMVLYRQYRNEGRTT